MPKKNPPSAFMMYVLKRKREMEQEGHKFQGMPDAVTTIGPEWENMSKEEKQPYDQKAKAKKAEMRGKQMEDEWPTEEIGNGGQAGPAKVGFPG